MNKLIGGSFPCPKESPKSDFTFLQPLHNPFPETIQSDDLDRAFTQPYIHAVYLPESTLDAVATPWQLDFLSGKSPTTGHTYTTVFPKYNLMDRETLTHIFILVHEMIHLGYINRTPFKELAKLSLALQYASIQLLMTEQLSTNQKEYAWEIIKSHSEQFNRFNKCLAFTEELLACSLAFETIEKYFVITDQSKPKGFDILFDELKEKVLQNEEDLFEERSYGFQETYKRFQHISHLMFNNLELQLFIIPLLQPIWPIEETHSIIINNIIIYNSERYLYDQIFQLIDDTMNAEEIISNLLPQYRALSQSYAMVRDSLINATNYSLPYDQQQYSRMPVQLKNSYNNFSRSFWQISHGDTTFPNTQEDNPQYMYELLQPNSIDSYIRYAFLTQAASEQQRYIDIDLIEGQVPNIIFNFSFDFEDRHIYDDDEIHVIHKKLLLYEGLRQQIIEKKGIICPFNKGTRKCQCSRERQSQLLKLSYLAVDGLFDEGEPDKGEWSVLPCRR